jgi:hypothetical protein
LKKAESCWRKWKAIEESRKPIWVNRILGEENWIPCEENWILGEGNLDIGEGFHNISKRFSSIGDSFPKCDWEHVCTWIFGMEIHYSQLKINHINDTPSNKAARGRDLQWCVSARTSRYQSRSGGL